MDFLMQEKLSERLKLTWLKLTDYIMSINKLLYLNSETALLQCVYILAICVSGYIKTYIHLYTLWKHEKTEWNLHHSSRHLAQAQCASVGLLE